jgi:hypothetical protein
MASIPVPPILTTLVGRIALAVPARARTTCLELLLGATATRSGHVTDAILTSGLSRAWTTYFWGVVQNLPFSGYTGMRKAPACEGRIATGRVSCVGGCAPLRGQACWG